MPRRSDLNHVLVIGSGPSSSGRPASSTTPAPRRAACCAPRASEVSLVNSNPATIMTDPEYADHTYVEPITPAFVEKVIASRPPAANKIDALLATLGGQTALNTAVAPARERVLDKQRRRDDRRRLRRHPAR